MNEFLQILKETEISAPPIEMLLLLGILSISLVFKASRVGLLAAFLFVFRWGYVFFKENFDGDQYSFVYGYILFGLIVVVLSIISMYRQKNEG